MLPFKSKNKPKEICTAISCMSWSKKGCTINKEWTFFTCGTNYAIGLNEESIKENKKSSPWNTKK